MDPSLVRSVESSFTNDSANQTGVLVAPAAFSFIYRFMGNKSEEYPTGYLNGATLLSFYGVKKQADGSLLKQPGYEVSTY